MARLSRHLLVRGFSALLLGSATLIATEAGGLAFLALVLIFALLTLFEWLRISVGFSWQRSAPGLIGVALTITLIDFGAFEVALGLAAVTALFLALTSGQSRFWPVLGVLYVLVPAWAFLHLRAGGPEVLYWLFVIVWITDIGAYVAGKSIGGPRLWPSVSPNKTWAGAIGGAVAGGAAGVILVSLVLGSAHTLVTLIAATLIVSVIAQLGDLAESAWKRHFKVKDSGAMIPGHGGVMDRLDSLIVASAAVALTQPYWSLTP